jgi:hypothetical protein
MARIRTIKPEFPQSETIGSLSRDARLLFIQLWTVADDDGRLRGASRMLASILYPYDDDACSLIDGWLDELAQKHCIRRYEVEGSSYIEIINWLKHQKIDRPTTSRLPAYSEKFASPREGSRTLDADLGPVPRTSINDDDGDDAGETSAKPPGEPLVSQWAHDLADEIGRMCGNDPNFTPPGWFGAPMRVESWRSEGWQREIILASVSEQLARKRDGPPGKIQYFEKGIARAHAEQTAKLPQVGPIATQTIEARHAAKANTPTAGIRALRSKLAGHGGSGLRADEDRTDVRMLSQGRGQ